MWAWGIQNPKQNIKVKLKMTAQNVSIDKYILIKPTLNWLFYGTHKKTVSSYSVSSIILIKSYILLIKTCTGSQAALSIEKGNHGEN